MPCLSSRFDASIGPLINIFVTPVGILTPDATASGKIVAFPALIDTGASNTCISLTVAQTVGLQPIGKRPMTSATHSVPVNVYLVDLVLPFGNAGLVLSSIEIMEFNPPGGCPFQMLVGRDIICKGVLTMSFDGHFSFSL